MRVYIAARNPEDRIRPVTNRRRGSRCRAANERPEVRDGPAESASKLRRGSRGADTTKRLSAGAFDRPGRRQLDKQ